MRDTYRTHRGEGEPLSVPCLLQDNTPAQEKGI